MKKIWQRTLAVLLGTAICLTLSAAAVTAEDAQDVPELPRAEIPVTIELTGDRPRTEDIFEVVLTSVNGAPMPSGTTGNTCTLEIEGEDTDSFPAIEYSRVGIYEYTVHQIEGPNRYVDYDETVFEITVYITNAEGGGYDMTVVAYERGIDEKCEVVFVNRYDYPRVPIFPPRPPVETEPPETEPPETAPPETVPPETIPPETEPPETEPEETEPPETETEPIETDPPEPEEILVQTGQLNWPISVLSFGGMGFAAIGCVLLKGSRNGEDDLAEDDEADEEEDNID